MMAPKPKRPKDMITHNNLLLIRFMKELGSDLWYKTKIEESDHESWKAISLQTRLKLIVIQKQWIDLRDQYVRERKDELENPPGQQTEFLKKYSEPMKFLESNESWLKCLSGQNSSEPDFVKEDSLSDADVEIIGEGETEVIQVSDDESPSSETKDITKSVNKRPASQDDDTIFFKTIETKLLKMDSMEKEQVKKDILKILQ